MTSDIILCLWFILTLCGFTSEKKTAPTISLILCILAMFTFAPHMIAGVFLLGIIIALVIAFSHDRK